MASPERTITDINEELRERKRREDENHWTIDKRVPIAIICGMVIQVIVWVWLGSAFYTQTNANQKRNDERFASIEKTRELDVIKFDNMQKAQTEILTNLAALNEKISSQTEIFKDIRYFIRERKIR